MAFKKGKSGNPGGTWSEKPFRNALRMELALAGEDAAALRAIAKALIAKAIEGDIQAAKEIADRLDGRPAQSAALTFEDKRSATDWSDEELMAIIRDGLASEARH